MCVKLNCQSNVKDYRHFLSHAQKLFTFHTFFLRKPQEPTLLKAGTTPRRMKTRMQETGHPRRERRQRAQREREGRAQGGTCEADPEGKDRLQAEDEGARKSSWERKTELTHFLGGLDFQNILLRDILQKRWRA